ncbi:MAG: hypothetical protein JXB03_04355 [Spirochaetales bacterium]|nr:hypothetical protein [Spirochaetales bacterium]
MNCIARTVLIVLLIVLFNGDFLFGEQLSLAVLYFENTRNTPSDDWLSKGIADMLISDLSGCEGLVLVEREALEHVLREQTLALSGMIDEESAPQIGSMLGAGVLVYGSYFSDHGMLRIDARAVDAGSARVLCSSSATGDTGSLMALELKIAKELAAGLGVPFSSRELYGASVTALKEYYTGVGLADEGDYSSAITYFQRAAKEDPAFLKPSKSIEDAYRFLKDFKKLRYQRELNTLMADVEALGRRIRSPEFYTFAQAVANPKKYHYASVEEVTETYRERPNVLNGDTKAQAVWYLQHLLYDLSSKAIEYFGDEDLSAWCSDGIVSWALFAKESLATDPFYSEVAYMPLLVYREREQYGLLLAACEEFMLSYPDHRMIWAVEDMYEYAVEAAAP